MMLNGDDDDDDDDDDRQHDHCHRRPSNPVSARKAQQPRP